MYDLDRYAKAFGLLKTGYQFLFSPTVRQAMVFVALNIDFEANPNKEAIQEMFGSTSGLNWSDSGILGCLKAIRDIGPQATNKVQAISYMPHQNYAAA